MKEKRVPFFARYLEGQTHPPVKTDVKAGFRLKPARPPAAITLKYPSDQDEGPVYVTLKYPSDSEG